jgi:hypothetical protein
MSENNLLILSLLVMFLTGCSQAPVQIDNKYNSDESQQRFHPEQIWSEMK